jgi:uncharacterized protein involved in response to NO
MLNIQDPELIQLNHEQHQSPLAKVHHHAVLDLAFRSYFLAAVLCSIFALTLWGAFLNGYINISFNQLSPATWHIHEMLFGFAATVAVGFILTAAQTWTGKKSIKGLAVLSFITLWLIVRVCLAMSLVVDTQANQSLFLYTAITLQLLWWLGSILVFTKLVFLSRNKRNYIFIPLFIALMLTNISLLILDANGYKALSLHIARTAVLLFCLLMGVLGGRVIPFFTVSGAKTSAIQQPNWLTALITTLSLLGILVFFSGYFIQLPFTPAILMIGVGIAHLVRLSYWRTVSTLQISLLWSLHLSYFSLGLGLILLGSSYLFAMESLFYISFADAIHVITIAAMGLMIFAMMSRVSLGHTGRALLPHKLVSLIFLLIFISAISRVLLPTFQHPLLGWNISLSAWLIAASLFLIIYFPILTKPKRSRF